MGDKFDLARERYGETVAQRLERVALAVHAKMFGDNAKFSESMLDVGWVFAEALKGIGTEKLNLEISNLKREIATLRYLLSETLTCAEEWHREARFSEVEYKEHSPLDRARKEVAPLRAPRPIAN